MSKEYNDRWNKPLVNPGITNEEYERSKLPEPPKRCVCGMMEDDIKHTFTHDCIPF